MEKGIGIEVCFNIFRHRHIGIALYYHGLGLVDCLRDPESLSPETLEKYSSQLVKTRKRLSELADHSEVNYRMYQKVVVSKPKPSFLMSFIN